jgi:hypothetical protein
MFIGLCNTQKQYFSDQSRIESDLVSPMKALQSAIERNIQTLAGGVDQPPAVGEARGKR